MTQLEAIPSDLELWGGLDDLAQNSYPGRIAIMGMSSDPSQLQIAYALTGRSEGSRQRIFVDEGYGCVRTVAPGKTEEEMAQTKDAELIYYQATRSAEGIYVVSNGAQTGPVFDCISAGADLEEAVKAAPTLDDIDLSKYEPDAPNYTPRITGVIDLRPEAPTPFGLAIVRKQSDSDDPEYDFYEMEDGETMPSVAVGYGVQTYAGNGDPLPSFDREPFAFPLSDSADNTAQRIWYALNSERRVAVVVHSIDIQENRVAETCIINAPA